MLHPSNITEKLCTRVSIMGPSRSQSIDRNRELDTKSQINTLIFAR